MAGSTAVARCEGCSSGRSDDITPLKVILILPHYCLLLSARLGSASLSFQCSASVLCCLISCAHGLDEVCEKWSPGLVGGQGSAKVKKETGSVYSGLYVYVTLHTFSTSITMSAFVYETEFHDIFNSKHSRSSVLFSGLNNVFPKRTTSDWSVCSKNFNVAIFSNTINMIDIKFCKMVIVTELYPFIPLSVTLIVFQGHSSVKHFFN